MERLGEGAGGKGGGQEDAGGGEGRSGVADMVGMIMKWIEYTPTLICQVTIQKPSVTKEGVLWGGYQRP